jgi:RHS repeat-associated protein
MNPFRTFLFMILFLLLSFSKLSAGWEMLTSNPRMTNIEFAWDLWFGIEYHGSSTSYFLSSGDLGNTWDTIPGFSNIFLLRASKDQLYASGIYEGFSGLYVSQDTARTWKKLAWPFTGGPIDVLINDTVIFVHVGKGSDVDSPVYRSTDNGASWEPMNIETGDANWNYGIRSATLNAWNNTIGAFIGSVGFFISTNGGDSWTKQNDGLPVLASIYAPLRVLSDGYNIAYADGWYRFIPNSNSWVLNDYKMYYFDPSTDLWKEKSSGFRIQVRSGRSPYIIAINTADPGGHIYYSIDNGKKWFQFSDIAGGFTSAFGTSVFIYGNYIYAGFQNGFARRSLSEARNHIIQVDEKPEYPVSPEELANLLNQLGPDALEELLDAFGIDSDEMTNAEIGEFLNDYFDEGPPDLFGSSQPASCNFMGMPLWSVNTANLKLFVRDMIFRKKGLGPEVKLALNYHHSTDPAPGIFGKYWLFEYQQTLIQHDDTIVFHSGTGARFYFTENNPVVTGATPFELPCVNSDKYTLLWTGTAWRLQTGKGYGFFNFIPSADNRFILESAEDAYGKKLSLTYSAGLPVKITDAAGREYALGYSGEKCSSITLPDGRTAHFTYNDLQLLESAVDVNGIQTVYTYSEEGNITGANISGKLTRFDYSYDTDPSGTLATVTDPEGRKMSYFNVIVDQETTLTNVTYPGNATTTYQMKNGLVTSITNAAGEEKKIFYNASGQPDSLVWYDGSSMKYGYDAEGNMVFRQDRFGKINTFEYNANRKLTVVKGDDGNTLYTNTYNAKNQLTGIAFFGGRTTSYTYTADGAVSTISDTEGNSYTFERDPFGNIISFTNPEGHTASYHYDDYGLTPTGYADFNGNMYLTTFDNNGRLTGVTLPDGSNRLFNYDCCGQTGITDENGNTISVIRDATNRILQRSTTEGKTGNITYSPDGYISSVFTLYGLEKKFGYDARGKLISITGEGGSTGFSYNNAGLLTQVTDRNGNPIHFGYNELNRLESVTDAMGRSTAYEYNNLGKLSGFINARNQQTTLYYDLAGNVTGKSVGGSEYAAYTYTPGGEVAAFTDSSGTTTFTRNTLGFVTGIQYPVGLTVSFDHDPNGNLIGITYPGGLTVSNTPDLRNRITTVEWADNNVKFDYDPAGNLLLEERSNNTHTSYEYNRDNVLIGVEHFNGGTLLASEEVTMNGGIVGSIAVKNVPPVSFLPSKLLNLGANSLNQPEGNIFNNLSFPHDNDGNMSAIIHNGNPLMEASYSHDNLLTGLLTPEGSVSVSYNAMGHPWKISRDGAVTHLFYDHKGRLLFETDESGSLLRNYIYRGRRLIATQTADGGTMYYHYNRQGHTLAISGSTGEILNSYAYSATGEIIGIDETVENHATFLGAFGAIRLTDIYILTGARVYSAQLSRYLQRDPLGIFTGTNPYLYASNNPVAGIDPLGLADQQSTVNTLDFDFSSDNDYGTAAGTADAYADNLPYRSNDWDTYGSAVMNTLKEFSDHPVSDLLPDAIANPVSYLKAIDKLANKEYGGALWQFMPFNNTLDAAGKFIMDKSKYFDPTKSSGLGIFPHNGQQTFTCEM